MHYKEKFKKRESELPNNCFNLTCPLSRFLLSLHSAKIAPIRSAERAAQVKQMLERVLP